MATPYMERGVLYVQTVSVQWGPVRTDAVPVQYCITSVGRCKHSTCKTCQTRMGYCRTACILLTAGRRAFENPCLRERSGNTHDIPVWYSIWPSILSSSCDALLPRDDDVGVHRTSDPEDIGHTLIGCSSGTGVRVPSLSALNPSLRLAAHHKSLFSSHCTAHGMDDTTCSTRLLTSAMS